MQDTIKILLVDDDESDYIHTKDLFFNESVRKESYTLSWLNNYEQAINAMLKQQYDVYLVDSSLGKNTGLDLLNEAVLSNCTEPIIILTEKEDLKTDEEALKNGAADYLVKDNLDGHILEHSIRYALGHTKVLRDLKVSEKKFRVIFERSKDPIIISDVNGKLHDANKAALNFFEITREELLKTNAKELYLSEEERMRFISEMEKHGSVTDMELQLILPSSGQIKYCSISSFLEIPQHGNVELYHSIIHDLTSRKRIEQESVISEKLAVSERIAKSLANEIRNPLSYVNLALDEISANIDENNESLQVYLDIVKENCDRIDTLANEFISSTEPKDLSFSEVYVNTLLKEIVSEAQTRYEVSIQYSQESAWYVVKADAEKLKEAILNIIQNAAESLPIDAERKVFIATEQKGLTLILKVVDKGNGIRTDDITKVFEPFYSTKHHATGLGLTYSQRIIKVHGGKIEIESVMNEGTAVTISLPLID